MTREVRVSKGSISLIVQADVNDEITKMKPESRNMDYVPLPYARFENLEDFRNLGFATIE